MRGAAVETVIGQSSPRFGHLVFAQYEIDPFAKADYSMNRKISGRTLLLRRPAFRRFEAAMAAINNMLRKYGALMLCLGKHNTHRSPWRW